MLLATFVVLVMLLTSGQMADLRVALPLLSQAMNWLEFLPLPFDMDHVVFFALVACALRVLLRGVRWWWLLVGLGVLAAGTELLQFGTVGRTPKLLDARDDMVGAGIGLLLGMLALWFVRRVRVSAHDRLPIAGNVGSIGGMTDPGSIGDQARLRTALAGWLTGRDGITPGHAAQLETGTLPMAVSEGVLVLLHDAKPPLPLELESALRSMARTEVALELARGAEARRVLNAMATAGIRALSLKGTALAYWLYAHPAQRPRGDLDLLVSDIACARQAASALEALGYELVADVAAGESADFEIALEYRSPRGTTHVVDLHWRMLNHALLTKGFDFDDLWAQSQPITKLASSARGLGPVHALLHAALHRVTNMPYGTHDRLVWLYDIHLLAGAMSARDWSALLRASGERGIATPLLDGLAASAGLLGTAVPEVVKKSLATLAAGESWSILGRASNASLDRAHLQALTWAQKVAWLRRKLFPSREFMRYRYGVDGLPGLAAAYVGRWWVGFRRGLGD